MPYKAEISRAQRGCIVFLIDQSASMQDHLTVGTKAQDVALILNGILQDLIIRCSKGEGVLDYFDIGVIGYGARGVGNGFSGTLGANILNPISLLYENPVRVDDVVQKIPNGIGGIIETNVKMPIWFEPVADGATPMCEALTTAAQTLLDWCEDHMESFPPVVIHLTDGEPTDGNPESIADQLRQISTSDGGTLLTNIHIASGNGEPVAFPSSEDALTSSNAKMLYRMSSPLSGGMLDAAGTHDYSVTPRSRAFIYGGAYKDIVSFFDIGTRPTALR